MTKPYPFQRAGVRKLHQFQGVALLADEMGLGKTFQVLRYIQKYVRPMSKRPIIVVCPASIKWNWQNEALQHINLRAEVLGVGGIGGAKPPKLKLEFFKAPMYIINYDVLKNWVKWLRRLKPQMIVLDECHAIKSRSAKRTRAARALCQGIEHRICISGTPMTNRPAELWTTLNILRPDKWPAFLPFAQKYCKPEWKPWGWQYTGASNLDVLHKRLRRFVMIRRRKRNVLKQLPTKTTTITLVPLSKRREYLEAERDIIKWLEKTHPKKARSARKAEAIVRLGYLKRLVGQLKLRAIKDWINNFMEESDGKLIFFGVHRKFLHPIRDSFSSKAILVDGGVTGHKRQLAFDKFRNKKTKRLLVGNMRAAGEGWNGQVASTVGIGELGWNPAEHDQAIARADRIGQKNPVNVHYLIGRDTIEEDILKLLQKKHKDFDAAIDGGKNQKGFDIYDRLEAILLKRRRKK